MRKTTKKVLTVTSYLAIFIAVITGGIQIYDRLIASPNIEIFNKYIYLTYSNSDTGLKDFLKSNNGKVVYIDNFIDTSLAIEEHRIVEKRCEVDIDAIIKKEINNIPLALPFYKDINNLVCSKNYLVLNMRENTTYEHSAGGTGLVMVRFRGFFEISTTYHSGPSIFYHLKETEVPFDLRNIITKKSNPTGF